MHRCHLCEDFFAPSFKPLLSHLARVHANSPDFNLTCGIRQCGVTFTNYHSYKNHVRNKHHSTVFNQELVGGYQGNFEVESISEHQVSDSECITSDADVDERAAGVKANYTAPQMVVDRKKAVALWILKLKEGRKLTQTVTDEILGDVTELCCDMMSRLKSDLYQILARHSAGIEVDQISELGELFQDGSPYLNPFSMLDSQYYQMQYYKDFLGFVVSPSLFLASYVAILYFVCMHGSADTFFVIQYIYCYYLSIAN